MKPIFCIDITKNKKNTTFNGEEFITQTLDEQESKAIDDKEEELKQIEKKTKQPWWVQVLKVLCGYYALIVLMVIIRSCGDTKLSQNLGKHSWIFISGIICAVVWILMQYTGKKRQEDVIQEENAEEKIQLFGSQIESGFASLGVPMDAMNSEILLFRYVVKKDKMAVRTAAFQVAPYMNAKVRAYVSDGALHVADVENVYSFALSELKRIKKVKKTIAMAFWHKENKPNDKEYKPYKLVYNDAYGFVSCKWYYILEGEHDGEAYAIYFPPYELSAFETLTGLKAEEIEE